MSAIAPLRLAAGTLRAALGLQLTITVSLSATAATRGRTLAIILPLQWRLRHALLYMPAAAVAATATRTATSRCLLSRSPSRFGFGRPLSRPVPLATGRAARSRVPASCWTPRCGALFFEGLPGMMTSTSSAGWLIAASYLVTSCLWVTAASTNVPHLAAFPIPCRMLIKRCTLTQTFSSTAASNLALSSAFAFFPGMLISSIRRLALPGAALSAALSGKSSFGNVRWKLGRRIPRVLTSCLLRDVIS